MKIITHTYTNTSHKKRHTKIVNDNQTKKENEEKKGKEKETEITLEFLYIFVDYLLSCDISNVTNFDLYAFLFRFNRSTEFVNSRERKKSLSLFV